MEGPTKSSNFRYIYSNAVGIGFNGQECILTFGMKADTTAPDTDVFQEIAVVMSPTSAKFLWLMLEQVIGSAEKMQGQSFPVDEAKVQEIRDIVAKAEEAQRVAASGAPTEGNPTSSPPPS